MNDSDKTKEQLLQEIELLRTLIDSLPDRLYVKDEKGRFVICNKAVEEDADIHFSGDPTGKTDFDLFTSDKANAFYAAEQDIIKTGKPMINEEVFRTRRKDGKPDWALCTKLPRRDKNGKIIGIIGSNRDVTELKLAEQALQNSEIRYKAIFESAREGILVVNIETRQFKYANPALCKMFGYTAEEFTHLTINDIHPKKDLPQVLAVFAIHSRGEKMLSRNIPYLRKDGTPFYVDIRTTNVEIDNTSCNVGFFTDITEHKRAEDALRESEARYKAIFNYATEGIAVADIETKQFRYVNQAACGMFGYTAEEFQQMTVYDAHPKEYIPHVIARFEAVARGEKTFALNVPCINKDGTVFYANINSTCVTIDQKPCNVGLFTNITERKKTEELLRQSEEKFRGIAERSSDMVFMTDTRGFITYLSPASERIFGYKPQDMVGKHFMNFLVESEIPKAIKRFTEKRRGKKHDVLYLEAKRKNGSRVFIELSSSLIIQDGKTAGTQGIIKDVTERRKAEEQLQKAHEELETRVKQRTADLAKAVETLQKEIAERKHAEAKLMLYQQQLRSLASELSLAEERLRRRIAAELHDHIAQNLAISKIKLESLAGDTESGRAKSLKEVIDLVSQTIDASRSLTFEISPPVLYELSFEAAVGWLTRQTRQRFGLDVEFINDDQPKPLNTDIRALLFQAVRELLVNIVKHAKAKKAKVYTRVVNDNIQVTVEDDGIGFDAATLNPVKDFTKGGFGLFNIRERLDQIGGSVIIHSGRKKGTQIILTAPIEKQKKPSTRFSDARSEKKGRRSKKKK